jgi:ribonuclease HI
MKEANRRGNQNQCRWCLHGIDRGRRMGYVIRDGEGEVIHDGACKLIHLRDALQAEVRACLEGLKVVVDWGIGNVILETDSLILTHFMKDNFYMLALAGGAMKGIITRSLKEEESELEKLNT